MSISAKSIVWSAFPNGGRADTLFNSDLCLWTWDPICSHPVLGCLQLALDYGPGICQLVVGREPFYYLPLVWPPGFPILHVEHWSLLLKVKVQVFYSLISSLKTYHRTLHLTPCSLDLFIRVPFQLPGEHTVLQPFPRIELIIHIATSVLPGRPTHFHLSQVKHLRVKCLAQGHTILTMSQDWEGRNMTFLWKSCTKQDSTSAERYALTIAPCPSLNHITVIFMCQPTEW